METEPGTCRELIPTGVPTMRYQARLESGSLHQKGRKAPDAILKPRTSALGIQTKIYTEKHGVGKRKVEFGDNQK